MSSTLHVNGQNFDVEIRPHETLADVLRDKLGLIGVKCPAEKVNVVRAPFWSMAFRVRLA